MGSVKGSKDEEAHQHAASNHKEKTVGANNKMEAVLPPKKTEPLSATKMVEPSKFRHLLPFSLCLLSFVTVMSLLVFYIDYTEMSHHQQFKYNMSKDYDLYGVHQEDPSLIKYIRDVHLQKYASMTSSLLANAGPPQHLNFTTSHEAAPELARIIAQTVGNKKHGVFFQSLSSSSGAMLTAPWLTETLGWTGFIVEPDPRKYFALRKENARRRGIEIIHACLSPTGYPKEVTLHHEVGINSIDRDHEEDGTEEAEGFHSRVKCFPLYTILLAVNQTKIDALSLGCQGHELEVLKTIPFQKVDIQVLSIHLSHHYDEFEDERITYMRQINKFLLSKSFKLEHQLLNNYVYRRV